MTEDFVANLCDLWSVAEGLMYGRANYVNGAIRAYWGILQNDLEQLATARKHAKKDKSKKAR